MSELAVAIARNFHAVSDSHDPADVINDRARDVIVLLLLRISLPRPAVRRSSRYLRQQQRYSRLELMRMPNWACRFGCGHIGPMTSRERLHPVELDCCSKKLWPRRTPGSSKSKLPGSSTRRRRQPKRLAPRVTRLDTNRTQRRYL